MSEKITTLTQMEMAAIRGLQAAGEVAQAAADAIEEVLDAVKADKDKALTYLEDQTDPDTLETPGLYSIGANKYLVLRHSDSRYTIFQIRITTSNTQPVSFAYRHNDAWTSGYWSEWTDLGVVPDGSITTAKLADGAVTAEKLADDVIPTASTSRAGIVQLNNTLTSTSTTQALTAAQGKALNDKMVKYGTCSTMASTAAKTVTISGFSLVSGALVVVKFTRGNTASSPTLSINGTTAKRIYRDGDDSDSLDLASDEVVLLVYDGTYYRVVDIPDASTTRAGKVLLNNTLTSTSTTQALTAAQGKALNDKIPDIEVESGSCTLRTNTGGKTSSCKYYKVGKMVTVYGSLPNYSGSSTYVSGLPFTPAEEASTITGTGTQAIEYYILYAVTNGRLFMRDAAVHAFYIEDQWKGQSFTLTYITDE